MNILSLKIKAVKAYNLAYDKLTSAFDVWLYAFNIPVRKLRLLNNTGKKIVVYTGGGLMPRITRIAKHVKSSGYATVLISQKTNYFEKLSNSEWDMIILYRNIYHLKRIIKQLKNIYIYHAFAPKSIYPYIVRRMVKTPFIIDMQDVYSCYYGANPYISWIKSELVYEKLCLKSADGVIGASLELNAALRRYGKPKPPSIYFPLYCDNDYFSDNRKTLNPGDIHIVYAGGIAGSHRDKRHYGTIQFHNLINILSEQQIHFHIYPSPSVYDADCGEYEEISKHNKYFHFHNAVSQERLAGELSRYHFGILPFFGEDTAISQEKVKYATSLKLFNYIEAGLPVIVSRDLIYQSWIVQRYKAGIAINKSDLANLKNIVSALDYNKMFGEMITEREEISLKAHIPRLINFYKQIAEKN